MSKTLFSRRRAPLGALLIGAAMVLTYVAGEVGDEAAVAAGEAVVATDGAEDSAEDPPEVVAAATGLTIEPASGTTNQEPINLVIPTACPTGTTDFLVQVEGAGFTNANMIGLSTLEDSAQKSFNAGGNWQTIAANNPGTANPLSGTALMTFNCLAGGAATQTYTGSVAFSPGTGGATNFQLVAGGSTTTPTPVGTSTPTPTPIPSPTPTPSVTPTPTPSETATPTPEPTDSDVDTDGESEGSGDAGNSGGGDVEGLPVSGGNDPTPLLLTAAMLGALGLALLLFEAASRLPEDWE